MSRLMPYMTNEEITRELWEYDEHGFTDMPAWLQHELQARSIPFQKRQPTEQEMQETIQDAKDHRLAYNERNIQDFKDKYLHKGDNNV